MVKIEKYITISFTAIVVMLDYLMTFIGLPWFGFFNKFKYICLAFVFFYVFYYNTYLESPWISKTEKIALYFYVAFSFLSSILNIGGVTMINPTITCINQCGILVANFLLAIVVYNRGKTKSALNVFLFASIVFWILSDITVIFGIEIRGNYLIGTKFGVVYHHIRTLTFLLLKIQNWNFRKKTIFGLLICESLFIAVLSECATGLIGTIIFVLCLYLYHKKNHIVQRPGMQIGVLIACALFPFWYGWLLSNRLVQYLIEQLFHKQLTLTGRTIIYEMIPLIIGDNLFWGYGIGSNMDICMRWGAVNIQNGMLKVLMESGLPGMLMVFILYFSVFFRLRKSNDIAVKAFSAYLLTFSILSSVEITIGLTTLPILLYMSVFANNVQE